MIEAAVYLKGKLDTGPLVEALRDLPAPIRPVYFAEDEGRIDKTNRIADEERFQIFRMANSMGFFLYSENGSCIDISVSRIDYSEVVLWPAEGSPGKLSVALFHSLVEYRPRFGYACEVDERDHRNRHYVTLGVNNIESWMGRKLDKYISGVYWCTLLSNSLLAQHGVNLADLEEEALTIETLGEGSLHLLKFFEAPEDWKDHADRLDDLCERVEGLFSRREVESAIAGVTNYLEYSDVMDNWL